MSIIDDDHLLYFKSKLTALYQTLFTPIAKSKGSATKPVYTDANGNITACTYTLGQNVTSSSKLTDTVTTVTTSGTGNAVTNITASNGALTVTKGDIAATAIAWSNITNKPSSFTPSSHTHSYVPLSGGTMSGGLTISSGLKGTADNSVSLTYPRSWTDSQSNLQDKGVIVYDTNGQKCGEFEVRGSSTYRKSFLSVYNPLLTTPAWGEIGIEGTSSGTYAYTTNSPATSDNSTKLATTSWVKSQSYAASSHTHSGYAASSHTHSGYLSTTGTAAKATGDASGNTITTSYGASLTKTSENKSGDTYYYINLKSKSGAVLSKINYDISYYSCGA